REFNLGMFIYNGMTAPWMIYVLRSRTALVVVLAAMAAQLPSASLHYGVRRRRAIAWPWAVIGSLSVVSSSAIGLHAAGVAVAASFLFPGGLFPSDAHPTREQT